MDGELKKKISALMVDTGKAHHAAFLATDGADPDWPIWYAGYLQEPLGKLLQMSFTKSQLVYCLMNADFERDALAPESSWHAFYADHFMGHFAPADTPAKDKLVLYHFEGCPFCSRARAAIDRLGLEVELRDIFADSKHRDELVQAQGRSTVPVLRITSPNGEERWMPESADIVRYLEATYG
ncbi:MAG: glutaredoxin [Betaproteobacteria bacterium]|nr:MAG: glutaredoxin [Betaproteobacteria bacterium]